MTSKLDVDVLDAAAAELDVEKLQVFRMQNKASRVSNWDSSTDSLQVSELFVSAAFLFFCCCMAHFWLAHVDKNCWHHSCNIIYCSYNEFVLFPKSRWSKTKKEKILNWWSAFRFVNDCCTVACGMQHAICWLNKILIPCWTQLCLDKCLQTDIIFWKISPWSEIWSQVLAAATFCGCHIHYCTEVAFS